ncbi:HTH domain-containing protein [Leptotrichia sp. OH3620_COT-345]|uniref:helix-turn-helix transcriptional regulator n=1 Tax=Leptotrichia sp. OH3620_COT-345 TaxID=2491048 RepID=UPI000F64A04A|nr:HTH domain-containing protein [Leptotrichia sp. OH3620_COT-345]RRD38902.1 HTH domain-containing protein [Leptotrichia sp. OH3620_COT-345]
MNKSERINDMMIYLNKKTYFNLKDITEKYGISKRTALRDIQSLERIGMAIYSELGRNGKYRLLNNKILSPIMFTVDEIHSLYFAILTLETYDMCPFNIDIEKLKSKFQTCLSEKQMEKVTMIEKILRIEMKKYMKNSSILKEILEAIIENKVCEISYKGKIVQEEKKVQFLRVFAVCGKWKVEIIDYKTRKKDILECEKILFIEKIELETLKNFE